MKPLELALSYMNIVFSTGALKDLSNLLAENLQFEGQFFTFNNAVDYIDSMLENPPVDFEYHLVKTIADQTSACLVYRFSKPGVSTMMTQVFETNKGKITKIWLVFDSRAFEEKKRE